MRTSECSKCGMIFASGRACVDHELTCQGTPGAVPYMEPAMGYECFRCRKTFNSMFERNEHEPGCKAKSEFDALRSAAIEAKAALYGCKEALGNIGNIQHAIDLLEKAGV